VYIRISMVTALTALTLLVGCASTHLIDTWSAPGLTPSDLHFENVVAIALVPDATQQRIIEEALAENATRTKVTPAYTLLTEADRANTDRLRKKLEGYGIDGAIAVRLVSLEDKETYVPGTTTSYGGGYYGYYDRFGTVIYEPGYYRTDTYVKVETSLYDVAGGKLLWAGVSETLNPSSVNGLIKEIVETARDRLREQGLLP
jgi:hypothetical protein